MTPKNHKQACPPKPWQRQEFTCADCAHFDEVRSLCRLANKLRSPRRIRCEGFDIEPLARLGGGTPHNRLEDEQGLSGYAQTREDQENQENQG
jgi:hypothetical protein